MGLLRLLLRRRTLLTDQSVFEEFRPGGYTDLPDKRAAISQELAANASAAGLDRLGRWSRLLIDGALSGVATVELTSRFSWRYKWLTWPTLALFNVAAAVYLMKRLGLRGLAVLGLLPLAVLAVATAGATNAVGLAVLGRSFTARSLAAALAGALFCLVLAGPVLPFLTHSVASDLPYVIGFGLVAGVFLTCLNDVLDFLLDRF